MSLLTPMPDPDDVPPLDECETEEEYEAAFELAVLRADQLMDTDR